MPTAHNVFINLFHPQMYFSSYRLKRNNAADLSAHVEPLLCIVLAQSQLELSAKSRWGKLHILLIHKTQSSHEQKITPWGVAILALSAWQTLIEMVSTG